jgi:PAP2 superfamily
MFGSHFVMREYLDVNGVAFQHPPTAGRIRPLETPTAAKAEFADVSVRDAAVCSQPRTWPKIFSEVLPHEWIFGTFLLLTGLRLFAHGGNGQWWSLVFFGCLAAGTAICSWAGSASTPFRLRIRLLFYPAAMGISFYAMGKAIPLLGVPTVDNLLIQWDRALVGQTPSVAWEPFLRPWLEDVAMAGYLFFFYYLIAGPGEYCIQNLRLFRKCIVGLFTMYGLAFMGYTVLPAAGPHIALTFKTPLHGPWLLDWTMNTLNLGSNGVDAFPSVHLAASLYLLLFDWKHWRRRFWWVLLPCLLLWFSTLYLRFHYFVDLLAAGVLAVVSWAMAEMYDATANDLPMPETKSNYWRFFPFFLKKPMTRKRERFGA